MGREQAKRSAKELKKKKIDFIFYSDILRTKQTAAIVSKEIGIKPSLDKRLREVDSGVLNGKPLSEARNFWLKKEGEKCSKVVHYMRRFYMVPPKAESYMNVEKRMVDFIKDMENKYRGKNIVIVSHQRPLTLLEKGIHGWSKRKTAEIVAFKKELGEGRLKKLN